MKISVAMATYNGEKYIEKQLTSICKQSQQVNEIVIIDDHSSDQTVKVIDEIITLYPQIDFKIQKNDHNIGYINNFRKAIKLCTGDIIFLCDQDDIWHSNKVEEMTHIMERDQRIKVLGSSFSFIDGEGKTFEMKKQKNKSNHNMIAGNIKDNEIVKMSLERLVFHNFCQGCALAITKEISQAFIRENNVSLPHDWQISLLGSISEGTYFYNKPLFYYRIHNNNTLGVNDQLSTKEKLNHDIRTNATKEVLESVRLIEKYTNEKKWKKIESFLNKNLNYMIQKKSIHLVGQMIMHQNYYSKLKSFKGQILDLLYTLS